METNNQRQQQSGVPQNEPELYNVYYQHVQNLRNSQNHVHFHQLHGQPNHTEQSPYGYQVDGYPNVILHGLNNPILHRPIINAHYYNIQNSYFPQQNWCPYAHLHYHYPYSHYANTCTYMISQQFPCHYNRNRYLHAPYLSQQNYSSPLGNHVMDNEYMRHFYSVLYYHMQNLKISDQKIQQNVAKPHVSDDKLYLTFGTEFMYCRSHRNYSSDSRVWARNAYETCYFSKLTLDERRERTNTQNANNPFSDQVKVNEWIPVDLSSLTDENNDLIPKSKPSATTTNEGHASTPDVSVNEKNGDATPKHTATTNKNCSTQAKAPEVQTEKSDGVTSHPSIAEINDNDWIFEIVPPSEIDKNCNSGLVRNIRINFDHSIFKPKASIQTNKSTSSTYTPIPSQQKNEKKRFPKREKQYEDYELPIPEIDPADYEGRKSPDPLDLLEIVLNNRISSMATGNDELPPEFVPNQPWPGVKNLIDNSHGVNDSKDNSNIVKDLNDESPPAFVPNQPWPGVKNLTDNSHGVNDSKDNSNIVKDLNDELPPAFVPNQTWPGVKNLTDNSHGVNDSIDNSNIVKDLNDELPPAFVPNQPWPGVKNLTDNSHGVNDSINNSNIVKDLNDELPPAFVPNQPWPGVKNLIDTSHGVKDSKDNSNIVKDSIDSSHRVNVSKENSYDANKKGCKRKRSTVYLYNQNNKENALVANRKSWEQLPIPCWELPEVEHLRQTLLKIPKPLRKCTSHPKGCFPKRYPLFNRNGSKHEHIPCWGPQKRAITKRNF